MPFRLPFNFPYYYHNRPIPNYFQPKSNSNFNKEKYSNISRPNEFKDNPLHSEQEKKHSDNSSECFFELFGLKLHFDDVLIMCILFFLYTEEVHDDELFLCLVMLLLS